MAIRILTKNAIDITNIDGARENNFFAGMRSGIVKGAFNEGNLFASSSNTIALDSCELIISGHRVVIDSVEYITLSNAPTINTQKSLFAEIVVGNNSTPSFRLFVESFAYNVVQDNLYKNNSGNGTYQVEIGRFLHKTDGTISDIVRTINVITGGYGAGGESGNIEDIKFNATAISLSSDSLPTANIDYNEDTKEYDLELGIPRGVTIPNTITIGSVIGGDTASATITGTAPNQVLNLVLPKGEKGDKGDTGDVGSTENTIQFNATINISSYADVDSTTRLDNPYINKILYPYYYNNIERMTIDNTFINTMNALEFGKEYEVTLDGIYTNFEVYGKLIKVPNGSDSSSSKYYTMYLITPRFSFIISNNFDNPTNDESIYFYGKPHCYKNTDTIPLVTIKSIKL